MKQALQFKLSQHLALTPQLQQSIRLLQLSTLELNQELEQMLADNPLLERLDDPLGPYVSIAPNGGLDAPRPLSESPGPDGAERSEPAELQGEAEASETDSSAAEAADGASDWSADSGTRTRPDDDEEREYPQLAANGRTLSDHLRAQLAGASLSRRDRVLVELLIDELDADGMLSCSVEEFHQALPESLEIDLGEVTAALRLLQSFDPTGVGARDLRECLLLQIDEVSPRQHPKADILRARAIIDQHLALLAAKDYVRLKRVLECDDEALRAAHRLIRQLDPRPGARFSIDEPSYVVPDVVVRKTRAGWTANLNADVVPKLRVNSLYAGLLRGSRGAAGNLAGPLQEARWLVKNIQQRFETILRVSQAIVDRQRGFFSHGAVAMKPLVLREIADTLGLHESTISRVTTQKFMLTPHGIFELKYFFGSHVATESGGAASSTAIRALIKQLVSAENAAKPLSDSQLADMLGEQGIVVARRTVAKYRESLRIPPVAQRKSI